MGLPCGEEMETVFLSCVNGIELASVFSTFQANSRQLNLPEVKVSILNVLVNGES